MGETCGKLLLDVILRQPESRNSPAMSNEGPKNPLEELERKVQERGRVSAFGLTQNDVQQ